MPANYVLLGTQTVGNGGASSVTLSNIPQTGYTDLKIVASARSTRSSYADNFGLRFNGDTGNNYSYRRLYALGSGTPASTTQSGVSTIVGGTLSADTATANTFGNAEFYIPNYTGSTYKSVSNDGTGENNATDSEIDLIAGIWNSTSAISSVTLYALSGNLAAGSTFYIYGLAAVGTTPAIAPFASGGDVIANDGTYWYHAFKTTGAFVPAKALSCDYLVVAGGGGGGGTGNGTNGGYAGGGGGGAGGYRTSIGGSPLSVSVQSYTITVGAGGAGGLYLSSTSTNGGNSTFSTITSAGGGGVIAGTGQNGGSGGGGYGNEPVGTGNTPSTSPAQGYSGTQGTTGDGGTGGGGATASPASKSSNTGSAGGTGSNSASTWATATATGASGYFAGGGGGGGYATNGGAGGAGGGAAGGTTSTDPSAAPANTGGGGGGATQRSTSTGLTGSNGGSGIVIIRYAMA